ncbi:MAG: hypothetical protein U5N10_09540 [Gemmobacter sp.]|nr:hypothetical protein [Gemmobacter sp.]
MRDRLPRALPAVLVVFIGLFPFANDIYTFVPAGTARSSIDLRSF